MNEEYENQQLRLLETLKKASKNLQTLPIPLYSNSNLGAIKIILEFETRLVSIFPNDPILTILIKLLSNLNTELNKLRISQDYGLRSFFRRQIYNYKITKISSSIEEEVQSWIDRKIIKDLVQALRDNLDEDKVSDALLRFLDRLSVGFSSNLQQTILRAEVFSILESTVCKSKCAERVREQSARGIMALVEFNRDVFVGQVFMGSTIKALVSMASHGAIQVLTSLIKLIKSPLVYEMEDNGYILNIIGMLSSKDLCNQVVAMECIFEVAYFARKEAVETMLEEGLINKLLECQRSGTIGNWPFTSCVTRFVGKLEVGEGLQKEEKREMKLKILRRIKEASISEAEATSIVADVLWGSSPLLN